MGCFLFCLTIELIYDFSEELSLGLGILFAIVSVGLALKYG